MKTNIFEKLSILLLPGRNAHNIYFYLFDFTEINNIVVGYYLFNYYDVYVLEVSQHFGDLEMIPHHLAFFWRLCLGMLCFIISITSTEKMFFRKPPMYQRVDGSNIATAYIIFDEIHENEN